MIVQKSAQDLRAETLVQQMGGTVTKNLRIINAFGARVKGNAIPLLARADSVRWVSLDAPVTGTATTTGVFTSWATQSGTSVVNTFSNSSAIFDSALGPNGTYGMGIDNTKGSFAGFDYEVSPDHAISKVEVLLPTYSPYLNHDFKVKIWMCGRQVKEFSVKHELFANHVSPDTAGLVAVDITAAKRWVWADLDNQLEVYLAFGGFDKKDSLYLDSIGLRVTSIPGIDGTGGSAPTSLPKEAIDTSKLVNAYDFAVRAPEVWNEGPNYLQGQGLTVAVVDSGIAKHYDVKSRLVAKVNFNAKYHDSIDRYGHGTFVGSLLAGDGKYSKGQYIGIAPKTNVANVRISDDQGMATESDVVAGLQWVLDNKAKYNLRVVNLALNSSVAQSYHTSPMNAAAEILWFNGIVVVVAAGNSGTADLFPPANDPFVITVGATNDQGTPDIGDDSIASFSAYGTSETGTSKPEIVAPGTNIVAYMPENGKTTIGKQYGQHRINDDYFRMSGTSMSAPIVSGAVALLLQDEPNLTPDQVKYRLMATANKNWANYDATRAGAGYLDIYAAVNGTTTESANTGFVASQLMWTGNTPITWAA